MSSIPVDPARAVANAMEAAKNLEVQKLREKADAERENSLQEEVDAEVFSAYECRSLPADLGKPHPGDISEPGLLAAVSLPPPTYGWECFEGEAIDNTKLSRLQLEGVLYAAQRHTHVLPDGSRAGFFIGDGAGVGKGRQIAGIVLDSWVRGRRKHVWFSISNDLKLDAERDLKDVGCHISVIDGCQGLDAASSKGLGMPKSAKHGCLFSTYSSLASSRSGAGLKKSRLDQLVDWCGGSDFDGCLVFDEAHKAKNFNSAKEENSTKVSQAVIKIQDMLPKARVVYCSATGVTDIGNLAYATRLGLWGAHSPFGGFKDFKENMEKRGIGALEMLAMELKAKGSYLSRGLGWRGAEFETCEVKLPASTVAMYDKAVVFWMLLRRELEIASKTCGNSGMCKADKCKNGHRCSPMRQFWGQQQRFFKEMANASKVEFVVEQAKEALSSGMSVVVGLQSTGESGLDKAMADMKKKPGDSVDKLVSAAHFGTVAFILQFFPTRTVPQEVRVLSDTDIDETVKYMLEVHIQAGNTSVFNATEARNTLLRDQARSKVLAAQQAVSKEVPECTEAKGKVLALAKELELLPSPLDALIDDLGGPQCVAEMTGRRGRLIRTAKTRKLKYELRPENEETSLNIRERELFMAGKKRIAIISDAASTGVSLHAAMGSGSAGNRRLHITLELPWSADKAIQQLGRSHRSNQALAPVFRLLVTDLGGERRFAAAVARRLASLGALTKGDRRAATGADFTSFDLDTKYGRRALRSMFMAITTGAALAPGVNVNSLRPFVEEELTLSSPALKTAGRGGGMSADAASAAIVADGLAASVELGPEAKEELVIAIMKAAQQSVEEMAIELSQYSNVTLFLGRLQGLPVRRQNLMFAYLTEAMEAVVSEARAAGVYDEGVADLRASSVTLKSHPEAVAADPATGATTTLSQVVLDRGVSWEQALAKRREAAEAGMDEATNANEPMTGGTAPKVPKGTGFYRSRHTDIATQKKLILLAVRKAKHNRQMVITRPNTGTLAYEMDLLELREKYERVKDEEGALLAVQTAWTQAYDSSNGADYRGSRKVTLGLLSGSVLPLWSALEKTVALCSSEMSKAEQSLKVYRVILDDGRKLVGVRVPLTALPVLRQHLREAVEARKLVVEGGGGGIIEPVVPLDPKTLTQIKTPPKNIHSYFGRTSSCGDSTASSPVRGDKRQAPAATPESGSLTGRGTRISQKRRRGSVVEKGGQQKFESAAKGVAALFGARASTGSAAADVGDSNSVLNGDQNGNFSGEGQLPSAKASEIIAIDD